MQDQLIVLLLNLDIHLILAVAAGVLLALTIKWMVFFGCRVIYHSTNTLLILLGQLKCLRFMKTRVI